MAIGEGPIGNIEIIYQNSEVWVPSDYPGIKKGAGEYFNGTATQAPWPYVVTTWPSDARPYKNVSYLAVANAELDASATVPQMNFVLQGFLQGTSPLNNSTIVITSGQYNNEGTLLDFIGRRRCGPCRRDLGFSYQFHPRE
jgi:hypothetical protein